MNIKRTKNELQNLISGQSSASYDAIAQATARYLRRSQKTGPMAERKHKDKPEETKKLIEFAGSNGLLIPEVEQSNFISKGAEQMVFIYNGDSVIKLNDSIYYASWEDYIHNLILHNYFFSDTSYQLLGFHLADDNTLYAVVKQPYIKADSLTNLRDVKDFMESNGFKNTRRHDYYNDGLGIIIEDLHESASHLSIILTKKKNRSIAKAILRFFFLDFFFVN